MTLDTLRARRKAALESVQTLAARAQADGRDFTAEERSTAAAQMAEAGNLKTEIDAHELAAFGSGTKAVRPGTWAEAARNIGAKALDPTGSFVLPAAWDGSIAGYSARSLLSIIPVVELDASGRFGFMKQTVRTNNAAAVAKGAIKPTSVISLAWVNAEAATIATLSEPIARQDLADIGALEAFLEGELRAMVLAEIDDSIMNGSGIAPEIEGILATSGVQSQAFDTDMLATIRKGITAVRTCYSDSGLEPDAIVLNPTDAETLDLTKDVDGRYYFGGPTGSGPASLWKVPVLESPAIVEGMGLVGAFRASVKVFQREAVRVDFSEHLPTTVDAVDTDLFSTNQRVYRAEARIGLAVLRPAGLCTVDLAAGS